MFSIKYGRAETREDKEATHWLKLAAANSIPDAAKLLAAGDGEYDRVELLMDMGDPGAASTMASVMHSASNDREKERALRISAENGNIHAMADLGWFLISKAPEEDDEARHWLGPVGN